MPAQPELFKKLCELANMCQEREPAAQESQLDRYMNDVRWNRDLVIKVGSQLRVLKSHALGLCLECHFSLSVPADTGPRDPIQGQVD